MRIDKHIAASMVGQDDLMNALRIINTFSVLALHGLAVVKEVSRCVCCHQAVYSPTRVLQFLLQWLTSTICQLCWLLQTVHLSDTW